MELIALDLGGTLTKCARMNENGEILQARKVPSATDHPKNLLASLDECVLPWLDGADGIAVSMPGKIDPARGIALTGGAFAWIENLPIGKLLSERYHLPVSVDNDGKCAAAAESWLGALRNVPNGLVYVIGTGIGGGIILDHRLLRGSHLAAGELSFALANLHAPLSLDNLTTLHAAAGLGLLRKYAQAAGETLDGIAFFRRVKAGNAQAVKQFDEFCDFTARFFFTLQAVLDLDCIAVGGGISAEPMVLEGIRSAVHRVFEAPLSIPMPIKEPSIVKCAFGNDANLIGAVKNYLETYETGKK